jgi:dihydrofolate reductase
MIANIIVAFDKNYNIGYKNSIPWHIPDDLANFKKLTTNNICVMGRNTWESLPNKFRPLPNRKNIIISSKYWADPDLFMKTLVDGHSNSLDFFVVPDFDGAMNICLNLFADKQIFIIGGYRLFKESLDSKFVKTMIVTHVQGEYEGDVKFPNANWSDWKVDSVLIDSSKFRIIKYIHV